MNKHLIALTASAFVLVSTQAHALDQILRRYQSNRSAGMGGVLITTGLYDENFFSNPARITANPKTRFKLLQEGVEVSNPGNISTLVNNLTGNGDIVKGLASTAGTNTHVRAQDEPLALFLASDQDRKWALGIGIFLSTQIDLDLRQSFQVADQGITDADAAFGFGYKFLEDKLSVGLNGHFAYRVATNPNFTFLDLIKGTSLSPTTTGGQGTMIDVDFGATYELPILQDSPFKFTVGAAIDNLLGGGFTNMSLKLVPSIACSGSPGCVPASSRSFSFGIAANRAEWGPFLNTVFAFEVAEIGLNGNGNLVNPTTQDPNQYGGGSLFRSIHIGGETHWKLIALRAGINQGYLTGGLGFDFRFFTVDYAYYGEEMSLNAGGVEDRRHALQIGFQI